LAETGAEFCAEAAGTKQRNVAAEQMSTANNRGKIRGNFIRVLPASIWWQRTRGILRYLAGKRGEIVGVRPNQRQKISDLSFRAERGISLFRIEPAERFLAPLGMTKWDVDRETQNG
jgi:hypothetical protein